MCAAVVHRRPAGVGTLWPLWSHSPPPGAVDVEDGRGRVHGRGWQGKAVAVTLVAFLPVLLLLARVHVTSTEPDDDTTVSLLQSSVVPVIWQRRPLRAAGLVCDVTCKRTSGQSTLAYADLVLTNDVHFRVPGHPRSDVQLVAVAAQGPAGQPVGDWLAVTHTAHVWLPPSSPSDEFCRLCKVAHTLVKENAVPAKFWHGSGEEWYVFGSACASRCPPRWLSVPPPRPL